MYCPMKFNSSTLGAEGTPQRSGCQCEEERCSWFNTVLVVCSIRGLNDELWALKEGLNATA